MTPSLSFLETATHRLAYLQQVGSGPTVMFLTGFKSDMTGTKAEALSQHCASRGQSFLRFDYSGHGSSSGAFKDGTIGQWKRDTLAVLDNLTQGEVILVGSSMGAWLALLVATERPERIKTLIGIASAPDFTERLIWEKLTLPQKEALLNEGVFYAPSCYGEDPYPITLNLIKEARAHLLLGDVPPPLRRRDRVGGGEAGNNVADDIASGTTPPLTPPSRGGELPITCPVHLLHGTQDEDVPVAIAHLLKQKIPQAELTLIEGGDHRLSTPEDLKLIYGLIPGI